MDQPTVAVVIPAYNAEKFIREAVLSAVNQTYPIRKIFVVDDGSTDHTANVVREIASTIQDRNQVQLISIPNGGHSKARNTGILAASEDFIALLDADDIWLPKKIEKQIELIQDNPEVGLVYCDYEWIDPNGNPLPVETGARPRPRVRGLVNEELMVEGNLISGSNSGVLVRRTLLQNCLFDETLKSSEDWDVWTRLSLITKFDFVNEILVKIRRHPTSVSHNLNQLFRYQVISYRKLVGQKGFFTKRHLALLKLNRLGLRSLFFHPIRTLRLMMDLGISPLDAIYLLPMTLICKLKKGSI